MMEFLGLLGTSTLFGGMMLYSFGFAPFTFKTLPVTEASQLLRQAFPWYYMFIIGAALVSALLVVSLDQGSALILAMVALVALYARQIMMPQINAARDLQLAGDGAAKTRFNRLHMASVVLNFVQLIGIGFVLFRFL